MCLFQLITLFYAYCLQYSLNQECDAASFVLFQNCFGYLKSFVIPYEFQYFFQFLFKNAIGILIRIALNLWMVLDSMDSLTI